MKPFDLEKALAGEMIYSPSGDEKAWLIGESKFDNVSYILEYEDGKVEAEKIDAIRQHFVMYEEPSPRPTVTLTLPCPLKEHQDPCYYLYYSFEGYENIIEISRDPDSLNKVYYNELENGLLFASREDAKAWANALKNSRR